MHRKHSFKHSLVVMALFAGFLFTPTVFATTRVFIQNNTSKDLIFNTTSDLGGAFWKKKDQVVKAWHRGEIFETNRDEGVKDGKTYFFTSVVSVKGQNGTINQHPQNFALRLQLKGSTVGSHMWQSVRDQVERQHTWHDDRKKWNAKMRVETRQWNVKYWAYFTGTDDNVEYVFQEEYPLPVGWDQPQGEWSDNHFNVLTWNVFMRGFPLAEYQTGRATMVGPKVPGYDAIAFNEVFDHDGEANLRESMRKAGYPNQTEVLGRGRSSGTTWNGGVMIVSQYPIVKTDKAYYGDSCGGEDCSADKGVLYAKIDKSKKTGVHNYFHLFATHMNQGGSDWKYQKQQLGIIKGLIEKQNIPQNEAIIVLGDMNINKCDEFAPGPMTIDPVPNGPMHQCVKLNPHYQEMLNILGAKDLDHKGYKYSHDGNINNFNNWEYESTFRPIHKGQISNLDHILIVQNGLETTRASFTETRILRHFDEWKKLETDLARWDISDHFAVYGSLHFQYDPLRDWDPGVHTMQLTRYYHGQTQDIVAVATTTGHNAVKQQGYQRVGDHGLLFRTLEAADQWAKSPPTGSGENRVSLTSKPARKSTQPRRSLSRIRSRGLSEGGQGSEGRIVGEMTEESNFSGEATTVVQFEEKDLDLIEQSYTNFEEDVQGGSSVKEEETTPPMGAVQEESGGIVERGILGKTPSRKLTLRPAGQGGDERMVNSQAKSFKLVLKPIVPLNLYYSDAYKDYFSTTSFVRAKQAMQGPGQYRLVGVQGYVFTSTMYQRLPNSLRSRTIPMYSWYNNQTRDHLIATGPGDEQHAQQNGYQRIALEGYLIKDEPLPPNSCKMNSDCPSSHYCDTQQQVCRPDLR